MRDGLAHPHSQCDSTCICRARLAQDWSLSRRRSWRTKHNMIFRRANVIVYDVTAAMKHTTRRSHRTQSCQVPTNNSTTARTSRLHSTITQHKRTPSPNADLETTPKCNVPKSRVISDTATCKAHKTQRNVTTLPTSSVQLIQLMQWARSRNVYQDSQQIKQ